MGKSVFIAAVAVVALVLWMLSGQIGSQENEQSSTEATSAEEEKTENFMKVQTQVLTAENITREIVVQGQLEPLKVINLRAQTEGNIEELLTRKGQRIGRGQTLARISIDNRSAEVAVANASLLQANNEYAAARKLQKQGLQSQVNLESAAAKREAARARLQAAELEVSNTNISSPIDALIEDVHVKQGDFVDRGATIATLVDNSQLLVTGRVPQQNVADIKIGQTAVANLVTGDTLEGRVHYLSSMADSTRSFKTEILIERPPAGTPTGISAAISIPVETIKAHKVSPAVLALNNDGTLGVKAIDEDNKVLFHKIEVVRTDSDGTWVTGLPDETTLITLGQGFVNPGETVDPVADNSDAFDASTTAETSAESETGEPAGEAVK